MNLVNFLMPFSFVLLAIGIFVALRSLIKRKWILVVVGIIIIVIAWLCFASSMKLREKLFIEQPAQMYLEGKSYDSMTKDEKNMIGAYYSTLIEMNEEELKTGIPTFIYYNTQWKMKEYNQSFEEASQDVKNMLDMHEIDYSEYMDVFDKIPK